MKSFTVAYITGREESHLEWFRASFAREVDRFGIDWPCTIVVDARASAPTGTDLITAPKPNIWQGQHRVTKQDWWANSNARNTAICLCKTEWIAFFDDRCVLMPGYLDALSHAMNGNYVMVGAYEKHENMTVQNGVIIEGDKKDFVAGTDCRLKYIEDNKGKVPMPFPCPGGWMFGAIWAAPVEWLLQVNGSPEIADGQGMEDVLLGLLLEHNGFPLKYDPRAKIIEDRTEGQLGPLYRREDKGISPNDKSHALLAIFQDPKVKRALHTPGWDIDLRKIRADVLSGKPWPEPPKLDYKDWWDGKLIREFV